jgi:hypothetical protein
VIKKDSITIHICYHFLTRSANLGYDGIGLMTGEHSGYQWLIDNNKDYYNHNDIFKNISSLQNIVSYFYNLLYAAK